MGLFTSGLSVNEFALLGRLGPQPLAQVMGASVVRAGWQYLPALSPGDWGSGSTGFAAAPAGPWSAPPPGVAASFRGRYTEASPSQVRSYKWHADVICELDVLTDAWNMARRRALARLAGEAQEVAADAVVGVHLRRSDHNLGKGTIEFVVSGTAIRLRNSVGRAEPTLTDVSVQDYWKLHSAGHEPVGLVATTSVVFASASRSLRAQRLRALTQNQELDELSRGFHSARQNVRAALAGQVGEAKGTGAVGVELSHSVRRDKLPLASALNSSDHRGWRRGRRGLPYYVSGHADVERRGWVITMHAAGTAVRRQHHADQPVKTAIRMGVK